MEKDSLYQNTQYLRGDQYRDSQNLGARAQLHQRFSKDSNGWFRWVLTFLGLEEGIEVLECGCGPGWLWRNNLDALPVECRITLTDLSPGMVAEAQQALVNEHQEFKFREADISALPFDRRKFDLVAANHMLYHVPDRDAAYSEVKRVLKKGGRFVAATVGSGHMRELEPIRKQLLPDHSASFSRADITFTLENGQSQLEPWFTQIELHRYENTLGVTEVEPLLAYVLSSSEARRQVDAAKLSEVRDNVQHLIDLQGAFEITTDSGLFVAYNGS